MRTQKKLEQEQSLNNSARYCGTLRRPMMRKSSLMCLGFTYGLGSMEII